MAPSPHRLLQKWLIALVTVALGLTLVAPAQAAYLAQGKGGSKSKPAKPNKISSSWFGMVMGVDPSSAYPLVNVSSVMIDATWYQLETAPGVWNWAALDQQVNSIRSHGDRPLLLLGQVPAFHSTQPTAPDYNTKMPKLDAWKKYVTAVTSRYKTTVDYIPWNEPCKIPNFWSGTPKEMATLVMEGSKIAAKTAKSSVWMMPPCPQRRATQVNTARKLYKIKIGGKPVWKWTDAVGLNAYPEGTAPPEQMFKVVTKFQALLKKYKVSKPLWVTEFNLGSVAINQATNFTDAQQEAYVARLLVLLAGSGVKKANWFGWGNWYVGVHLWDPRVPDNYVLTPAGRTYQLVQGWILNRKVGPCLKGKKKIWSCEVVGKGTIMWREKGSASVPAPKKAKSYQDVLGTVVKAGKKIPVSEAPIFIQR